ncbi:hypothetical protein [Halorubrum distributum]|uniref:hypothetical protein n=1 Tax=Halorubrum distributum TaxID=29283 RepID=UPI001267E056|nr:hypothetical protein [Halorubrum arcis]
MSEEFYHVDGHGELESGDEMDLEWPPKIKNDVIVKSPESNEEELKQQYPEGLSRHGARYAQSAFVTSDDVSLGSGWEAMTGLFKFTNTENGDTGTQNTLPYQVLYEWVFELIRIAEFENAQSRFQSYFAWPTLEDAEQFVTNHREGEGSIYRVSCEEYEQRDMDLIETPHLGIGQANARKYWNSEPGSESPTWEVVMEPPIDVLEKV